MKPLTPAQQRVVDVMKTGIKLQTPTHTDIYYLVGCGSVTASTANVLISNRVIRYDSTNFGYNFYTLSPEYNRNHDL